MVRLPSIHRHFQSSASAWAGTYTSALIPLKKLSSLLAHFVLERLPLPCCLISCTPEMVSQHVNDALVALVEERDWAQFHTSENLAKSISIEAAELLECFQWGAKPDPQNVRHELADVLTYCYHLARGIGADPEELIMEKLEITRKKYPVDKARGNMTKYDRL